MGSASTQASERKLFWRGAPEGETKKTLSGLKNQDTSAKGERGKERKGDGQVCPERPKKGFKTSPQFPH